MTGAGEARARWLVFWLSAAVIGHEVGLMRLLLVAGWHHFAFLVISVALLGFGASGTALTLVRGLVDRHRHGMMLGLALAAAAAMPASILAAQHVPVEARLVPALLARQAGAWVLSWALLAVPFFLGAGAIGAALMTRSRAIPGMYAANLLGSAAGAVAAPLLMHVLAPPWLPVTFAGLALIAAAAFPAGARRWPLGAWLATAGTITVMITIAPPHVRIDPYKYGATLHRLAEQGDVRRLAVDDAPRARLEAYAGDVLHDLPFLGVGEAPPPITVIVSDGHLAASLLHVADLSETGVVERTLMAAAYDLAPESPRTALLGEMGGINAWLAAGRGARIDIVQPHASLVAMLRGPLRESGGSLLGLEAARAVVADPRHFIEHAPDRYDVIQLVAAEGTSAGSGGIGGLAEDHLLTVEGLGACLAQLTSRGVVFVCRGIQTPPRDSIKMILTFAEALRRRGVAEPGRHLVVVRDYLAVCTIARNTPWSESEIEAVRAVTQRRGLTPAWFPGIRADELNHPDMLPGPPGADGDWYHHVASRLDAPEIPGAWRFDVRPATDDRPFFHDFCRLSSLPALRESFGELWLTRTELAFPFVLGAGALVATVGALLTLLPLAIVRRHRRAGLGAGTAAYFGAIGLAYLGLEMVGLSRLTHLVGDPVLTASITIAGFLCFSGIGCLAARMVDPGRVATGRALLLVLVGAALLQLLLLQVVPAAAGALPLAFRIAIALGLIAVPGVLMGFPMPLALARLARSTPAAVPWAWGVNGFASVLAAPLTVAVGMSAGYTVAGIGAVVLYALAALVFVRVGGAAAGSGLRA